MDEKKVMTIADVADALGVSKTTVSRAISGKGRLSQTTRNRVLAYIEKYDYKPNVIAQGLAQSKTYNICAVMHGSYGLGDLHFFQECLVGIQKVASSAGYDILLSICQSKQGVESALGQEAEDDISSLERIIKNRKVDGVILMRTFVKDPCIAYLLEEGIPFVTVGRTQQEGVIQIDHDHQAACRELTSMLLLKGLSRIALIGGDSSHVVTRKRYQGYREAFEQRKLPVEEELLFFNMDNDTLVDKAVTTLLKESVHCILCMDDVICSRVLRKLHEKKVSVPEDIRVASFYHSPILETNIPAITSLHFDAEELGREAGECLLLLIDGKPGSSRINLPYEVVFEDSTR